MIFVSHRSKKTRQTRMIMFTIFFTLEKKKKKTRYAVSRYAITPLPVTPLRVLLTTLLFVSKTPQDNPGKFEIEQRYSGNSSKKKKKKKRRRRRKQRFHGRGLQKFSRHAKYSRSMIYKDYKARRTFVNSKVKFQIYARSFYDSNLLPNFN